MSKVQLKLSQPLINQHRFVTTVAIKHSDRAVVTSVPAAALQLVVLKRIVLCAKKSPQRALFDLLIWYTEAYEIAYPLSTK